MLEKKIESSVVDYAKKRGCWVRKFTSPGTRAAPDRIFAFDGSVWFIEFKSEGKEATKLQKSEHAEMRRKGLRVYVVDSIAKGKAVVDLEVERAWL